MHVFVYIIRLRFYLYLHNLCRIHDVKLVIQESVDDRLKTIV